MATVYYAENNLHLRVAIKVLKEKFSKDPEVISRFKREAQIMMRLDDVENVCHVYDCREFEGKLVIIMEYLEGLNLRDYVKKKGPIHDYDAIRRMCAQVLDALSVAHSRNIIHRDIKPSNLFLVKGGIIKLLDFGISKILFGEDEEATEQETQTRQKMGTISYMSPEQIKSTAEVDGRTDIYAFGMTLYNLMTGNDPLEMESDSLNEIPDERLVAAIRHAIRKNLERRTPDCQTFLKELQDTGARSAQPEEEETRRKMETTGRNEATLVLSSKESALYDVYMDGNFLTTARGNSCTLTIPAGKHDLDFKDKMANRLTVHWINGYYYAGETCRREIAWGKIVGTASDADPSSSASASDKQATIMFMTGGVPCDVYADGEKIGFVDGVGNPLVSCPSGRHTYEFRERGGVNRKVSQTYDFAPGASSMEMILFPVRASTTTTTTTSSSHTTTKHTHTSSSSDDDAYRPIGVLVIHWLVAIVLSIVIAMAVDPDIGTAWTVTVMICVFAIGGAIDWILKKIGVYY